MTDKSDYQVLTFEDSNSWLAWLTNNHQGADGIWLRMYKKATGLPTVTYAEALDAALCYGWIDGQRKSYDEQSFIQKFTPRRKNSLWSKRNIEYVARLQAAGLMTPAGQAEIDRAMADGRWDAAYDKPSEMTTHEDLLLALEKQPIAQRYYESLNKSNRYTIAWKLQTAKTVETRQRRLKKIIDALEAQSKDF